MLGEIYSRPMNILLGVQHVCQRFPRLSIYIDIKVNITPICFHPMYKVWPTCHTRRHQAVFVCLLQVGCNWRKFTKSKMKKNFVWLSREFSPEFCALCETAKYKALAMCIQTKHHNQCQTSEETKNSHGNIVRSTFRSLKCIKCQVNIPLHQTLDTWGVCLWLASNGTWPFKVMIGVWSVCTLSIWLLITLHSLQNQGSVWIETD